MYVFRMPFQTLLQFCLIPQKLVDLSCLFGKLKTLKDLSCLLFPSHCARLFFRSLCASGFLLQFMRPVTACCLDGSLLVDRPYWLGLQSEGCIQGIHAALMMPEITSCIIFKPSYSGVEMWM